MRALSSQVQTHGKPLKTGFILKILALIILEHFKAFCTKYCSFVNKLLGFPFTIGLATCIYRYLV